jgi:Nucleotide modification associated domain 3
LRHLVLSRKGFDASAGRGASPYFPEDGRLLSLPIPDARATRAARTRYADITFEAGNMLQLLRSLYPRRVFADDQLAHLDPDLSANSLPERDGGRFRGLAGQANAAAAHLRRQMVDVGDLFLFFGRFRAARSSVGGSYAFEPGAQDFHALFGYLEVANRIRLPDDRRSRALKEARAAAPSFPHFLKRHKPAFAELVYVAREQLSFRPGRPGFGLFRYSDRLRLTRPNERLSAWRLPACFDEVSLTYNPRTAKREWHRVGETVEFRAAGRGQEFVCSPTSSVQEWARKLVSEAELWEP